MTQPQPEKVGESREYWTHKVDAYPSPVAQFRMAQLIDLDDRLYENARIVYRFLVGWYHDDHGDALFSMRHVSKVMKQRAPAGANVLSHSVVQRGIIALMETGWVVRTFKGRGKGKGASRFVPVLNVLELAAQGKFPELSHSNGTVELSHSNGTVVSRSNGTDEAELSHSNGPKTLLPDPLKDAGTGKVEVSAGGRAAPLAPAAAGGFERIWRAYGRLGNKAAARQAFDAIVDPDVDHIAARATAWAASARPGQHRMPLEKWLAGERYDEADRARSIEPANDNTPEDKTPKPTRGEREAIASEESARRSRSIRRAAIEISAPTGAPLIVSQATIETRAGDTWLAMQTDGGRVAVLVEGNSPTLQEQGQAHLERLAAAVGLSRVEDADHLVGRTFRLIGNTFERSAA